MSQADAIIDLYERRALDWDRDRGRASPSNPVFEAPWLDRFLTLLEGPEVLDLGCGSGDPIGRYIVDRGAKVTGVDASPALIEICASKFPRHAWISADMRN